MATVLLHTPPDPDDPLDPFRGERYAYTHGACHRFAHALHRITGWQMVFWQYGDHQYVGHLGVRDPDGAYWDARGQHASIASFVRPFTDEPPDALEDIGLDDFTTRFPELTEASPTAERIASIMFPELPHLPNSDRSRTLAFMDTVEALSRAHGVWIMAASDELHRWPIIGEEFDGVAGYQLLGSRGHFTFDRAFARNVGPELGVRYPMHIKRFIIELTALSQEYKRWIRAPNPSMRPRLVMLSTDNATTAHYAIQQSLNGGGFYVNLHRG